MQYYSKQKKLAVLLKENRTLIIIILLGGEACWTKASTELFKMIVMAFDSGRSVAAFSNHLHSVKVNCGCQSHCIKDWVVTV